MAAAFFHKLKGAGAPSSGPLSRDSIGRKKHELAADMTPLQRMLLRAGPLRSDGSDKFFGLENSGHTCYCNSIMQVLFHSDLFRDNVINFPPQPADAVRPKIQVTTRSANGAASFKTKPNISAADAMRRRQIPTGPQPGAGQAGIRPEDQPGSPEYKKRQAMVTGPVLDLTRENASSYGMQECTFTGLRDIFLALVQSESRTGVLSPQRFLELFKRDNEMFRNSMHQDAHEFYGLVLNDVISDVEAECRRIRDRDAASGQAADEVYDAQTQSERTAADTAAAAEPAATAPVTTTGPGAGWVHEIFQGVLTSETTCLTCETPSRRDETFLDLSIDLEDHSSVTSCLRNFSREEMLSGRNKFHCDTCGVLQEAEKRMKIKRLPRVLALHLKRFKYTEDHSRLQKLFHRVSYPYHLRLFNTTDDAADPDRLYELYGVVIHIGGNAYHGHYVSVVKTRSRGWLLFDDEMVEPVDRTFVRNFFGDKAGMPCAYVLFYRETTFENVLAEQEAEGEGEYGSECNGDGDVAHDDDDDDDAAPPASLPELVVPNAVPAAFDLPGPGQTVDCLEKEGIAPPHALGSGTPSDNAAQQPFAYGSAASYGPPITTIRPPGPLRTDSWTAGYSLLPTNTGSPITPLTAAAPGASTGPDTCLVTAAAPAPAPAPALSVPSSPFAKLDLRFDFRGREEKRRGRKEQEKEAEKTAKPPRSSAETVGDGGDGSSAGTPDMATADMPALAQQPSTSPGLPPPSVGVGGFFHRTNRGGRSMARKSFAFLSPRSKGGDVANGGEAGTALNGVAPDGDATAIAGSSAVPASAPLPNQGVASAPASDQPEKTDEAEKPKNRRTFGIKRKNSIVSGRGK